MLLNIQFHLLSFLLFLPHLQLKMLRTCNTLKPGVLSLLRVYLTHQTPKLPSYRNQSYRFLYEMQYRAEMAEVIVKKKKNTTVTLIRNAP